MILKQFKSSREGSDCLITNSVMLVTNGNAYIVLHTIDYLGSWTPDEPTTHFYGYGNEKDAMSTFDMIVGQVM